MTVAKIATVVNRGEVEEIALSVFDFPTMVQMECLSDHQIKSLKF
jgi:hypothetical protein